MTDAEMARRWARGETARAISRIAGVSRSTVIGRAYRRGWVRNMGVLTEAQIRPTLTNPRTTMMQRLQALHDRMDAVLADNVGVGRLTR
jgi:hypothetical protein